MEGWRVIPLRIDDPFYSMAIDEAILKPASPTASLPFINMRSLMLFPPPACKQR